MKQGRDTAQEERIQIVKDCLSSGETHYGRIEGEVRHKANGSQVRRTILLFRADQCQRIGGGQNSSLHNVQFFHVIQTFLRNFSR